MENPRFIKEGDVRKVIEESTYTTTLKDLEKRGKSKVRVVKARQIYRLIAEAVNRVITESSLEVAEEERERLVEESKRQLDQILKEHGKEEDEFRDSQRRIEKHLRRELESTLERVAELRQENEQLRAGSREAAPAPVSPSFMEDMLAQMANLREGFQTLQEMRNEPAPAAPSDSVGAAELERVMAERESRFADQFQNVFDQAIEKFAEQVDQKMSAQDEKLAAEHVEAAEVVLDSLFAGGSDAALESNLAKVNVKQDSQGGIAANLERLRSMSRKTKETT